MIDSITHIIYYPFQLLCEVWKVEVWELGECNFLQSSRAESWLVRWNGCWTIGPFSPFSLLDAGVRVLRQHHKYLILTSCGKNNLNFFLVLHETNIIALTCCTKRVFFCKNVGISWFDFLKFHSLKLLPYFESIPIITILLLPSSV